MKPVRGMPTEAEQHHYAGMMEAACILFEAYGPFWLPTKGKRAYDLVMDGAREYWRRACERAEKCEVQP